MEIIYQQVGDALQSAVFWSSFGTLQSAPALNGLWTDLPDAANPYLIPTTNGNVRFYRLQQ